MGTPNSPRKVQSGWFGNGLHSEREAKDGGDGGARGGDDRRAHLKGLGVDNGPDGRGDDPPPELLVKVKWRPETLDFDLRVAGDVGGDGTGDGPAMEPAATCSSRL